jgi:hypothetical protein
MRPIAELCFTWFPKRRRRNKRRCSGWFWTVAACPVDQSELGLEAALLMFGHITLGLEGLDYQLASAEPRVHKRGRRVALVRFED